MAPKRKLSIPPTDDDEPIDPSDELMFLCLGGGNEVGRSCHIIQYKGKTVMLDAGMHPSHEGLAALPYFDEFDLSTVDVLLISHFHVDHAASLPYVLAKTNFKGRVFMTHPTKAIYKWLIQDNVRLGNASSSADQITQLYTEADHLSTFPQIEAIDYHTTHTVSSIRITPYPAGHVLGAAMFLIEIGGLKILFTGDYSREDDRHLISAEVPKNVKIDVLITESTYGIATHIPRAERETALIKSITSILNRGGKVLMPVFALGRAQELLLILDEYWARHPEFHKIPIYYASNLARKCMVVYQTYVGAMNDNIKRMFRERMAEAQQIGDVGSGGPWDFRFVRSLKNLERFDDVGGCVMLASPGMMQNGVSRELLERWAPSERNGVVITGYSVEGTMARHIMTEPETIPSIMGNRSAGALIRGRGLGINGEPEKPMIPRRCSVQELSFAAHVDGQENREFIEEVAAPVVILVHGEKHNMMRLKSKLLSLNADKAIKTKIFSPANTEELRIPFKADKTAKVVGKLAQSAPPNPQDLEEAQLITGVLVQNDFKMSLMAAEDLREYAGLTTTTIMCKQRVTLGGVSADLIRWALEASFGTVEEIGQGAKSIPNGTVQVNGNGTKHSGDESNHNSAHTPQSSAYLVMGCVIVRHLNHKELMVEWEGNVMNDSIADSVVSVLLSVEGSPAAVKQSCQSHRPSHNHNKVNAAEIIRGEERFSQFCLLLESHFSGSGSINPVNKPQLFAKPIESSKPIVDKAEDEGGSIKEDEGAGTDEDEDLAELEAEEMDRLHSIGLPVPGLEVRVDKHAATVWLETLEVDCPNGVVRDRVKAGVEQTVESMASFWGHKNHH